mmetsp:Transcript_4977/g.7263  ORF Transcript_4977/g.7263 Transcript_4977/m.7263 type:complete len:85 (-) Transcript_4977:981-1235(-)
MILLFVVLVVPNAEQTRLFVTIANAAARNICFRMIHDGGDDDDGGMVARFLYFFLLLCCVLRLVCMLRKKKMGSRGWMKHQAIL